MFFLPIGNVSAQYIGYPTAINTLVGTVDAGELSTIQILDGNTYDVSEIAAATPAIQIDINYTVTSPVSEVTIHGYYDGNAGHTVNVQAYNFTDSSWEILGQLPDAVSITEYDFPITGTLSDLLSNNVFWLRIEHTTSGNPVHDVFIDYTYVTQIAPNDQSTGTFEHDLDNDPPVIEDWYEPEDIVEPDLDILLWVTFQDIDNTSGQMSVIAFASNDSFVLDNNSLAMAFFETTGNNTYRFVLWFDGQENGVEYDFYFSVYDGETRVRRPLAPTYVTVQWVDTTITTTTPFDGSDRFQVFRIVGDLVSNAPLIIFAMIVFGMIVTTIIVNVNVRTEQRVAVPKDASITKMSYEFGRFYLGQSARMLNSGFRGFLSRGAVVGKKTGKGAIMAAHTAVTTGEAPEVQIRGIGIEASAHPKTTRQKIKNIFVGVFADAGYLLDSLRYRLQSRAEGDKAPKAPKRAYQFKNPLSVYYRKARGKVRIAEQKAHQAQKKIPSSVNKTTDSRKIERKIANAQKTLPARMNNNTKKKFGFFQRTNKRLRGIERKIGKFSNGRKN